MFLSANQIFKYYFSNDCTKHSVSVILEYVKLHLLNAVKFTTPKSITMINNKCSVLLKLLFCTEENCLFHF